MGLFNKKELEKDPDSYKDPIVIDLDDMNFKILGISKTSIKNWE